MTRHRQFTLPAFIAAIATAVFLGITPAKADLDGHGPDAWRVTGVSANDVLNARMGPGTSYPVIEVFSHNERGMQQITCVPFYTPAHYAAMTQAQIKALPQRWCLMRNASMSRAGWVAQRYIVPDDTIATPIQDAASNSRAQRSSSASSRDPMTAEAVSIVRKLYDAHARAERGAGPDPLQQPWSNTYFADAIQALLSTGIGAHPLYGAQDFEGGVDHIAPDPDQPMLRGMITINVDFTNFGQRQRAIFFLRADPTMPGAPLRIFRVEHDGWSYP